MKSNVAILAVVEEVSIDQRRIAEIVGELGQSAAHTLMQSALEHLALAVRDLRQAAGQGDLAQVVHHADRLSRLAWQLGLVSLAGVAVDVARCAEAGDHASFAATLARIERVSNRSLLEIWNADLQGDD